MERPPEILCEFIPEPAKKKGTFPGRKRLSMDCNRAFSAIENLPPHLSEKRTLTNGKHYFPPHEQYACRRSGRCRKSTNIF
jgi:hypothetical protein